MFILAEGRYEILELYGAAWKHVKHCYVRIVASYSKLAREFCFVMVPRLTTFVLVGETYRWSVAF